MHTVTVILLWTDQDRTKRPVGNWNAVHALIVIAGVIINVPDVDNLTYRSTSSALLMLFML